MNKTLNSKIGFIFGTAAFSLLAGCVGYVDVPRGEVYPRQWRTPEAKHENHEEHRADDRRN